MFSCWRQCVRLLVIVNSIPFIFPKEIESCRKTFSTRILAVVFNLIEAKVWPCNWINKKYRPTCLPTNLILQTYIKGYNREPKTKALLN